MKHATRPAAATGAPLNREGSGEAIEADKQTTLIDCLLSMVTLARPAPPDGGEGEPVKVCGLAAEGSQAGCAGATRPDERRFWAAEAESSGLPAEGIDADASSTTTTEEGEGATSCEPGLSPPRPKLPPYFMVFDVESIGLHGEGFAFGYVVIDSDGTIQGSSRAACPSGLAYGSEADRYWVAINVPPLNATRETPTDLRDAFWGYWRHWADLGAVLVADVAWPVEARFLAACVDDDPVNRALRGPYPLHELTSIALALGADVDALWSERLPCELPAHDPLNDARHSARILAQLLKARLQAC